MASATFAPNFHASPTSPSWTDRPVTWLRAETQERADELVRGSGASLVLRALYTRPIPTLCALFEGVGGFGDSRGVGAEFAQVLLLRRLRSCAHGPVAIVVTNVPRRCGDAYPFPYLLAPHLLPEGGGGVPPLLLITTRAEPARREAALTLDAAILRTLGLLGGESSIGSLREEVGGPHARLWRHLRALEVRGLVARTIRTGGAGGCLSFVRLTGTSPP